MKPNWQVVTIKTPENAATELQSYIESHANPQSGVLNLLYKVGNLESMLQLDFRKGEVYHYGLDHRPATEPLRNGIKATFPQLDMDKNFIDISGNKRKQLAHDPNARHYQITEAPLTEPSEAIEKINKQRNTGLLQKHGMWGSSTQAPQNALTIKPSYRQPVPKNRISGGG